jgi:hypothetical protein
MYIFIYIESYLRMKILILSCHHFYIYIWTCIYKCTYINLYMYIYIYIYMYTYISIPEDEDFDSLLPPLFLASFKHFQQHIYTYVYMYIYIYTYTHFYKYIHIYRYVPEDEDFDSLLPPLFLASFKLFLAVSTAPIYTCIYAYM